MNAYRANVLIHVDQNLATEQLAALRGALARVEGVTQVMPSARPHLVRVDYNPRVTGGRAILGHVRQQGLQAQLVGL